MPIESKLKLEEITSQHLSRISKNFFAAYNIEFKHKNKTYFEEYALIELKYFNKIVYKVKPIGGFFRENDDGSTFNLNAKGKLFIEIRNGRLISYGYAFSEDKNWKEKDKNYLMNFSSYLYFSLM